MKKNSPPDPFFLGTLILLLLVGTIMVFSSSPVMGLRMGDSFHYLKRHIFYLLLGSFAFLAAMNIEPAKMKKWGGVVLFLSVGIMLLLFVPQLGKTMGGATRWLDLYFMSFQPSELVKFAVVLFLAAHLSRIKDGVRDPVKGLLPVIVMLAGISAVIIVQPDLGTAISILGSAFIMLFIAGARIMHLSLLFGAGGLIVLALSVASPYRMSRLIAFVDPWKDPLGRGFQIIQSLLAVGSGGLIGLGLGASRQKFYYLPQQYADFIFAVLCEETGFVGAAFLLSLFLVFFLRGIKIAAGPQDSFSSLLGFGIVSLFFVQTAMNLMVVVGLLPTTGIPLPFVSYGGTAMIMNMFMAGILAGISRVRR